MALIDSHTESMGPIALRVILSKRAGSVIVGYLLVAVGLRRPRAEPFVVHDLPGSRLVLEPPAAVMLTHPCRPC